jgi:broad specificity phosphatase PhoE
MASVTHVRRTVVRPAHAASVSARAYGHRYHDIRTERPGWTLWGDGVPGGEAAAEVGARADRVIAELSEAAGDVAVFAHGHLLRVLAARWLGLEPTAGQLFALDTATISVLGYERETAVMRVWNEHPR